MDRSSDHPHIGDEHTSSHEEGVEGQKEFAAHPRESSLAEAEQEVQLEKAGVSPDSLVNKGKRGALGEGKRCCPSAEGEKMKTEDSHFGPPGKLASHAGASQQEEIGGPTCGGTAQLKPALAGGAARGGVHQIPRDRGAVQLSAAGQD